VQEIEDACLCRQGILYSHDELNVRAIIDQSEVDKLAGTINMRNAAFENARSQRVGAEPG
jgi:hypothetical protein